MTQHALNRLYFLYPFFLLPLLLWCLSTFSIFVAVPLAIVVAYAIQTLAQKMLAYAPLDMKQLHKTVGDPAWLVLYTLTEEAFFIWYICSNLILGRHLLDHKSHAK